MPLGPGARLGPYEILSAIGAGGMGEVYRATDTTLGRQVAIKVLPESVASDPERIARFEREARTLASLNHPHIAQIYGLERSSGVQALVMELVEGEDLSQRIARGPIPLDEALGIAKQIAEALEAALEQGIIHRDLKPSNIKLTPDGVVKVLDFGLAKLNDPNASNAANVPNALSVSPTITSPAMMTGAGVLLGTAAYMAPEQAKGRPADKRSDLWAFGCVIYEMLTGKRPFGGDDISETLAAVLRDPPDWSALPSNTPRQIQTLLRRCLEKDRAHRLDSAAAARLEIDDALNAPATETGDVSRTRAAVGWIAAALFLIAAAVLALVHFREAAPAAPPEMRLEITTPSTPAPLEFALSPDGRYIVFVASGGGPQRLWLRALDKTDAQPMAGTEGADYPFWSPDSRSIAFTAAGKLLRIDIGGGSPQILASVASVVRSGAWNADGTILFNSFSGLSRVAASGGNPSEVTRPAPGQTEHRHPTFLPDGRHFLFEVTGTPEAAGLYLGSLDGAQPKRLTAADSHGAYLSSGVIAFVRDTALMTQRLDLTRGELTGDPVEVADPVGTNVTLYGGFSISADGRIAYRGGGEAQGQLRWYDRTGKALGVAGAEAALFYPELSPDGRRVAIQRTTQANGDVWLMDLVRGGMTRFTFDPALDNAPVWSPDGTRIAFYSARNGPINLYVKPANGTSAEQLLLDTPIIKVPQDWSRDGRFLVYYEVNPKTGRDLWVLPVTGSDRKPIPIITTPFDELNGQFSPDGRWIAYETNESRRFEIVVQPFPSATAKWQVSTGGGVQPRWRADGKELYFIAPDGKMMAASVTAGASFVAGTPRSLFSVTVVPSPGTNKQQYAVARDGRFLINEPTEQSSTTPITLILNWKPKP